MNIAIGQTRCYRGADYVGPVFCSNRNVTRLMRTEIEIGEDPARWQADRQTAYDTIFGRADISETISERRYDVGYK